MLKQFKNGNIHIKLEPGDTGLSVIEKLYFNYDLYPVSAEYCLSNFHTGIDFCYNGGSNYYTITSIDLDNLENGKMIILYPLSWDYVNEYLLDNDN